MNIVADTNIPFVQAAFGHLGELKLLTTHEINSDTIQEADILLVRSETKVDKALLEGSQVRFVGTATIGTDHVDLDYLNKKGIGFANAPGSNANSVAEYILAALLALGEQRGFALKGKTLGVVGVGNIGSRVVRLAEVMGMQVLQNDPPLARATGDSRFLPLDDLMEADILTLHVPLTKMGRDATFHLFDKSRLAKMKPGSILINTSRGGVVETAALKEALAHKTLDTCVLDVWENEPNIDTELLSYVALGTPHIAGYSLDGKVRGTRMIYEAVCQYFDLPSTWDAIAGLPEPRKAKILVSDDSTDMENVIRNVVKQCYDIEQDDKNLRVLLSLTDNQRPGYFERLRSEYPVRREFFNTAVLLSSNNKLLSSMLKSLGFRVGHTHGSEVK
ncbi:MAG: 4-phosphoerythronate dehydrogenase PdxB [bacterium]